MKKGKQKVKKQTNSVSKNTQINLLELANYKSYE